MYFLDNGRVQSLAQGAWSPKRSDVKRDGSLTTTYVQVFFYFIHLFMYLFIHILFCYTQANIRKTAVRLSQNLNSLPDCQ